MHRCTSYALCYYRPIPVVSSSNNILTAKNCVAKESSLVDKINKSFKGMMDGCNY